jgi:hypothetical protein
MFDAVVFDVLGTVVDEDAGRLHATTKLLGSPDEGSAAAFAEQWATRETELVDAVHRGERSWVTQDDLGAEALPVTRRLWYCGRACFPSRDGTTTKLVT